MLSNAYFLAKFRFDTAENEPAKNLQKFAKIFQLRMIRSLTDRIFQPRRALVVGPAARGPGRRRRGRPATRTGCAGPKRRRFRFRSQRAMGRPKE